MGIAFLAGLCATITLSLGLHLFTNAIPKLARIGVSRAARRLPSSMKHNQEAAWLADLASLETHFEMLSCATACWMTSYRLQPPFVAEKSHRELVRARAHLRAHGALVGYALNRIKAWDTSTDPKKLSLCERWCIGVILVSKLPIEQGMRNYFLCLERELKERPRQYTGREDFAKDWFLPIHREMKTFQFLQKHDLGISFQKPPRHKKARGISRGANNQ